MFVVYFAATGRPILYLALLVSFALAAGVGVFATLLTREAKRFAALAPLRASRASRVSVSSRVSVFFIYLSPSSRSLKVISSLQKARWLGKMVVYCRQKESSCLLPVSSRYS